jgi:hypothetical protein
VIAVRALALAVLMLGAMPSSAGAQTRASAPDSLIKRPRIELFGQFVTDVITDFNQVRPAFFDVLRASQLPAFKNEFGRNQHQYFSPRPTRFGVRMSVPTAKGEIRGIFDWDLFGSGPLVGRTGFNLVRAYAEIGKFGAGQYNSPFMDIDVFPNQLEYWGPTGMVFFRNVQVRYMPVQGDSRVTLALERPGATGDRGDFEEDFRFDLANVVGRFPWPDLSAEGRLGRKWGYVELAGILRGIYWDDLLPNDTIDLDGSALGWGVNLTSNIKTSKRNVIKFQLTYGEAIQNYMDAPFDIGVEYRPFDRRRPVIGVPLPVFSGLLFYDHSWNDKLTTSLGYSALRVTNSRGQSDLAYRSGQYALINLLYNVVPDFLIGGEFQWGHRRNAFDGWGVNDFRLQLTARFDYSITFTRDKEKSDGK